MERNLVGAISMDPAKASTLRALMEEAFPDAAVEGWTDLERVMSNHPKDRHVAAAAVAADATVIVTNNLKDFRNLPDGVTARSPDDFLCELRDLYPDALAIGLYAQAASYSRPPMTPLELLEQLAGVVPRFSRSARALLPNESQRS
jgi:hypothetical protein